MSEEPGSGLGFRCVQDAVPPAARPGVRAAGSARQREKPLGEKPPSWEHLSEAPQPMWVWVPGPSWGWSPAHPPLKLGHPRRRTGGESLPPTCTQGPS